MNKDYIRNGRIVTLYKKALTEKYDWIQLEELAMKMGVTRHTAKSYIDAVELRLRKRKLIA